VPIHISLAECRTKSNTKRANKYLESVAEFKRFGMAVRSLNYIYEEIKDRLNSGFLAKVHLRLTMFGNTGMCSVVGLQIQTVTGNRIKMHKHSMEFHDLYI
jgi:hypothetical protein